MPVMYPRPPNLNIRGIHWSASTNHTPALNDWDRWGRIPDDWGLASVKLLDDGRGSAVEIARRFLSRPRPVIPIVRIYQSNRLPSEPDEGCYAAMLSLFRAGVRYVEWPNEPNLRGEWNYADWAGTFPWDLRVAKMMDSWVSYCKRVVKMGLLPAFPAVAQNAHTLTEDTIGSIPWYVTAFRYLAEHHGEEMMALVQQGLWIASHPATLNHPFDYPYDERNQKDHKNWTIMHDDCGALGFLVPHTLMKETFGADLPVIATEGGVFTPKGGYWQEDNRYPAITEQTHAILSIQLYEFYRRYPQVIFVNPWLIANQPLHNDPSWNEDGWIRPDRDLPVVALMKSTAVFNELPSVELVQAVRNAAWGYTGIPMNPEAAFPIYARAHHLGGPRTSELDILWGGKKYRVQGFMEKIVGCEENDWANVRDWDW